MTLIALLNLLDVRSPQLVWQGLAFLLRNLIQLGSRPDWEPGTDKTFADVHDNSSGVFVLNNQLSFGSGNEKTP